MSLVLATMSEVARLGVHVGTLLVAPRVDQVAQSERNARVRQVLHSATEAVKQVSLEDTGEGVLLERGDGCIVSDRSTYRTT